MIRYDRDTVFDVMDEIRGEFGKCFDPNDGTGLGINIGLNYIF